jgi:hypothetical protein
MRREVNVPCTAWRVHGKRTGNAGWKGRQQPERSQRLDRGLACAGENAGQIAEAGTGLPADLFYQVTGSLGCAGSSPQSDLPNAATCSFRCFGDL